MAIGEDGWRYSQVAGCIERASTYHLSQAAAHRIVADQVKAIEDQWDEVCGLAGMSEADRGRFQSRQFLNPYSLERFSR